MLGIATYNVLHDLSTWATRRPLIVAQLAALAPDAIALQEVAWTAGGSTSNADELAAALDMAVVQMGPIGEGRGLAWLIRRTLKVTGLWWLPLPGADQQAAMGVLSVAVEAIAQPSRRALLHTAHLAYALGASALRQQQALAMHHHCATWRDDADGPALHVLVGDFNATPDADEMRFLRGLTALGGVSTHWQDAWLRHHAEGPHAATWSTDVGERRAARTCDVDRRLDYIYVSTRHHSGVGTVMGCELAMGQRDDATQLCGSDHLGVVAQIHW